MWAKRQINADEWTVARGEVDSEERALRVDMAAIPAPVGRVDPALIREGWGAMNLDERRQIISMFIERVTVVRARPGTMGFDKDRVKITWRSVQ
jgi:site-specific DNA recombinase